MKVKGTHCADELSKNDAISPLACDAQLGAWRNEMYQSPPREPVLWDISLSSTDSCGVTALKGLCSQFMKMDEQIRWPQGCAIELP